MLPFIIKNQTNFFLKIKIQSNKPLNLNLWEHIMNDKLNMICVLILNNINQHLIVVQLAFIQIFQLKGCAQYESQGNIMNVPTNLDLVQHILAQMPYHDSSIAIKQKQMWNINLYIC